MVSERFLVRDHRFCVFDHFEASQTLHGKSTALLRPSLLEDIPLWFSNSSLSITHENYNNMNYSHHLFRLLKQLQYVTNSDPVAFDRMNHHLNSWSI